MLFYLKNSIYINKQNFIIPLHRIYEVDEKYYADEEDAYNMRCYFSEEERLKNLKEKKKGEGSSTQKEEKNATSEIEDIAKNVEEKPTEEKQEGEEERNQGEADKKKKKKKKK